MANFNISIGAKTNQAPTVGDGARETQYGVPIVFTRADFTDNTNPPYNDPEGDAALTLRIDSLPASGVLALDGVPVTINQEIDFADIDNELLTYAPDLANTNVQNYNFLFAIADAGSGTFTS